MLLQRHGWLGGRTCKPPHEPFGYQCEERDGNQASNHHKAVKVLLHAPATEPLVKARRSRKAPPPSPAFSSPSPFAHSLLDENLLSKHPDLKRWRSRNAAAPHNVRGEGFQHAFKAGRFEGWLAWLRGPLGLAWVRGLKGSEW